MFTKFKTFLLVGLTTLFLGAPLLLSGSAFADICSSGPIGSGLSSGIKAATGSAANCNSTSGSVTSGIKNLAGKVVNIFSIIVGVISIIMIIYGGFRYITSGGDSGKVGNAKNTLIYAIIGLVIVALAQLIVHYVLSEADTLSDIYRTLPRF
jgi:hypothetical protein